MKLATSKDFFLSTCTLHFYSTVSLVVPPKHEQIITKRGAPQRDSKWRNATPYYQISIPNSICLGGGG